MGKRKAYADLVVQQKQSYRGQCYFTMFNLIYLIYTCAATIKDKSKLKMPPFLEVRTLSLTLKLPISSTLTNKPTGIPSCSAFNCNEPTSFKNTLPKSKFPSIDTSKTRLFTQSSTTLRPIRKRLKNSHLLLKNLKLLSTRICNHAPKTHQAFCRHRPRYLLILI